MYSTYIYCTVEKLFCNVKGLSQTFQVFKAISWVIWARLGTSVGFLIFVRLFIFFFNPNSHGVFFVSRLTAIGHMRHPFKADLGEK
jgi:hypothetical protein